MKKVNVDDSVGLELVHDLTGFPKGGSKRSIFKKGYIIKAEDIEVLKDIGKYHIFQIEENDNLIHESEGALKMAIRAKGINVSIDKAKEGKVFLRAEVDGLVSLKTSKIIGVSRSENVIMPATNNLVPVKKGDRVLACGITPLFIDREELDKVLDIIDEPLVDVMPIKDITIGVITTGTEIYEGRIEDKFLPFLSNKLKEYSLKVNEQVILPDDYRAINEKYKEFLNKYDCIFITGGMSVDPDDNSKLVLRDDKNLNLISYGAPVLPGAMFLMAYSGLKPVVGIPAGMLQDRKTLFDILLPMIVSGYLITADLLASLSIGGIL